eukprot:GFUD01019227.1.p1 GENE.GFUD01019227.1~~GFUD01019227.1.p1  ORF type:complete len:1003 (+),score=360.29 GFUD01019227.1:61-3069(+)
MSSVSVKLLHPKSGVPLTMTVPLAVAGPCGYCGVVGRLRCSVCRAWYCTGHCQASHWPVHRRDCVRPPPLLWPDGSRYEGEEVVVPMVEEVEQDMTSMTTLVSVGSARLEQILSGEGDVASVGKPGGQVDKKTTTEQEAVLVPKIPAAALVSREMVSKEKNLPVAKSPPPIKTPAKTPATPAVTKVQPTVTIATTEAAATQPRPAGRTGQEVTVVATQLVEDSQGQAVGQIVKTAPEPIPGQMKIHPDPKLAPGPPSSVLRSSSDHKVTFQATQEAVPGTTVPKTKASTTTSGNDETSAKSKMTEPLSTPPACEPKSPSSTAEKQSQATSLGKVKLDSSPPQLPATQYTPAISSTSLPVQSPPPHLTQVVLPVDDITSPGQFGVRLVEQETQLNSLLEKMLMTPPQTVQGWKVGRRETVAVVDQEIWYRGLAVRKMGEQFEVYLLDYGGLITVAPDQMRPLPADCAVMPAATYQVCLAGLGPRVGERWAEEEGKLMGEILNSSMDYKLGVEFLGQVEGGRWAVRMRGMEEKEDIGQILLGGELARAREDVLIKSKEQIDSNLQDANSTKDSESHNSKLDAQVPIVSTTTATLPTQVTSAPVPSTAAPITVSRGALAPGSEVVAVVCYLETPAVFYICPTTSVDQFTTILTTTQNCPSGEVLPTLGICCLAKDEDCWYRAEIVQLNEDQTTASLFLLDYGKTIQANMTSLRPLPQEMASTPGLACKVSLNGIKSGGKDWSEDQIGGAEIVLDVGKDVTQFSVKVVKVDSSGEIWVSMKDSEGTDVATLMIETEIAVADMFAHKEVSQAPLEYQPGCLAMGTQSAIVLTAISPMELYICSQAMFMQLSTSMAMLNKAAASSTPVTQVQAGDPVLACDDDTWYRGKVAQVMPDNMVQVELVDLASTATLSLSHLRKATPEVMKEKIVAVSCCLDTWVEEDRKVAIEKWGAKMTGMVEQHSELQVEVVGQLEGAQFRVKIPELEKKMNTGVVKSRAEILKEKLRKK